MKRAKQRWVEPEFARRCQMHLKAKRIDRALEGPSVEFRTYAEEGALLNDVLRRALMMSASQVTNPSALIRMRGIA